MGDIDKRPNNNANSNNRMDANVAYSTTQFLVIIRTNNLYRVRLRYQKSE